MSISYSGPMIQLAGEWSPVPPLMNAMELMALLRIDVADCDEAEKRAEILRRMGLPHRTFGRGGRVMHCYPTSLVLKWVEKTSKTKDR